MTLKVKIKNVPWFDNEQLHFPGSIVALREERHYSAACMEKLTGWPKDPASPAKPAKPAAAKPAKPAAAKPAPVKAQPRRDRSRSATPKAVVETPARDDAAAPVAEINDASTPDASTPDATTQGAGEEDVPWTTDAT